jgi:F-type H+-transporting ATPase subunit gamma
MLTLEALRRQIGSAEDLRGIVHTMKTMAAVSIRQYQRAVEALGDYQRAVAMGLQVVLADQSAAPAAPRRAPGGRAVAVICGSDQGMCGSFNEQIVSFALRTLAGRSPPGGPLLATVGERARARLAASGHPPAASLSGPASANGITAVVQALLLQLDAWRAEQPDAPVLLFYNALVTGARYRPQCVRLMPVDLAALRRAPESAWPPRSLPIYRMDPAALLSGLVRQHLFISVFRALAESLASENASRLTAMQAAERNIDERLAELEAQYHQQRQTAITSELLDIVSGFEVLTRRRD